MPLPTTGVYYLTSSAGLSHSLSQSWQASISSRYGWRRYDNRSLVDGRDLGVGAQLGHSLGRSGSVFTSYEFVNNWYADAQSQAHEVLLGGRHQPKRGLSFEIAGGAAYLLPAEVWYPAGSAQHQRAAVSRTSMALAYQRDFGQLYGYGRQTVARHRQRVGGVDAGRALRLHARRTRTRTGGTRRTPSTKSVRRS